MTHTPVFLQQVLSHVNTQTDTRYIDCTFGEGGHATALAKMGLEVLALEADVTQIEVFQARTDIPDAVRKRIHLVQGNYAFVADLAVQNGFNRVDGVLFDLGLSMAQINSERGFSYKHLHQPLDMVIDTNASKRGTARAADVVAEYEESELVALFEKYSERLSSKPIAKAIVNARINKRIETVGDLRDALMKVVEEREFPAIFQALRMEVNEELEAIRQALEGAKEIVKSGGTIQIITFHSIEDRLVKLWARSHALKKIAKYVGREISTRDFERSAILRVYQS